MDNIYDFKNLVEREFDRKILYMQTDWGGEYKKLNYFFSILEYLIMCHVHTLTNKMALPSVSIVMLLKSVSRC